MEAFRHIGYQILDRLFSRNAKIIKGNMCAIALIGAGSGALSFPPRDTEIELLPILEVSDTEEIIFLPGPPLTEEEIIQKSLEECDNTRDEYARKCAESKDNKTCNVWMYHAKRCSRWRNPDHASVVEDTGTEEDEISSEEIAQVYGFCTGSLCWGDVAW